MSQKSILSFFKTSATTSKETKSKCVVVNDSPVKKVRNKRKVQCIESDDESSTKRDLNGDSKKDTETSENGVAKSSESSSRDEPKEKSEIKDNSTCFSGKPSKLKKTENSDEKKSLESPEKAAASSSDLKEDFQEPSTSLSANDSCDKSEDKSDSPDQNGIVDFIPKRKTARKQISSAKHRNDDLKVVKNQSESKISENEITNDSATSDKNNSPVKDSNGDMSDPVVSTDTEKDSKNKKSLKNSENSVSVKSKTNSSSKDKGSPVKKSVKKESIHSFFTSLKKPEDKSNDEAKIKNNEETKSKRSSDQEETEDSPVKKPKKQKRKIQSLESDEENEDCEEPVSSVTEETKITNGCTSPDKNEGNKASENSTQEENKSSSKETDTETSKSGGEKQKLSVKSTSVVTNVYDPSKNSYHPIEDACWKRGEKVPYLALAKTLELIENTSGRLKIIEILANFLRSVIVLSPDDMLQSVYLCLNRLAPEYCGIELGVGETLLMKAVAQATGRTVEKIKAEVAVKGDLGLVSESSRGNQRVMFAPPKLTVSSVFQKFLEIAKMSGNASMAKKTDKIKGLFVACRDCEAKYIIRSLSGKLRIGLAEQSVLCAIARAAVLTPPDQTYPPKKIDGSKGMSSDSFKELVDSQVLILKTAYCECPNYDLIIPVLLKEGISALPEHCQLSPGVPLKPMLAHPTAGIDKVLERFDKNAFTCEFKYDGERAQIHMTEKGEVKIFSRNQEDNTSKYPDIISRLPNALKDTTKTFILDSEAVAWDNETKQILPFQVLSTRKKKDAVESEIKVQVCIMAFDLLYLNGESLVKKPLKDRRSLLHSSFKEVENEFLFAQYKDGNSAETMQEFLDESVKGNCEGLMVKALETDASYEIAKRSHNWLKLKKDYLQGIGDTLDLVVIGGYYGKGKRTGNYGGFLLACYDEDNEEFQSICKLGTGFKDDILDTHTKFLKQHTIEGPKSYFRYDHSLEPDVWFETVQVWEIKCADLSISPVHKAAMGIIDPEKGISLRFPRFIRIRDDKTPENATTSVQIADMYQKQQQIQNTSNKNAKAEEDYY